MRPSIRLSLQRAPEFLRGALALSLILAALRTALPAPAPLPTFPPQHEPSAQAEPASHNPDGPESEPLPLKVGETIEREIKGGNVQTFSIQLDAGQYARLAVERRGVDLLVTVTPPDRRAALTYENPAGAQSPVYASLLSEARGNYTVEVRPVEKWAAPARYSIRVEEVRARTPADEKRMQTERKTAGGRRLQLNDEPEARRTALTEYAAALKLWEEIGDSFEAANTLHFMAQAYRSVGQIDDSLRHFDLAIDRRGEVDMQAVAYTLLELGATRRDFRNPKDALPSFERALAIFRQANNRRGEAAALYGIGFSHMRLWNMPRALEYLRPALALYRAEGMRYEESRTLNSMGGAYDVLLRPLEAIDHYNLALGGWEATGDLSNKGLTLNNLGKLLDDLGEWQEALDHYDAALRHYAAAEISAERNKAGLRSRKATTLYNLGYAYVALGDLPRAFDYLQQSLALREDPRGRGTTLTQIAYVFTLSGEPHRALEHCQQALPLLTQANDPRRAQTLTTMGAAYGMLGEHRKALDSYQKALEIQQNPDAPDLQAQALTLDHMGGALAALGEADQSLKAYERALTLWRSFGERNGEALTLYHAARVERDRGDLPAALQHVEAALGRTEALRGKVTDRRLRSSFLAAKLGYYELYIDLKMRLGEAAQTEAAFDASERARARSLLDMLSDTRAEAGASTDPALAPLVEKRRAVLLKMRAESERRARLLTEKRMAEELAEAEREIARLGAERDRLETQIKSEHPRYASLMFPEPLPAREVRKLLDSNTVLLEFFLGEESSYLWAVTPMEVSGHRLPRRAEIERAARRLKELLRAGQRRTTETAAQHLERAARAEADYWKEAPALSQTLLGPVAALLGEKRLLIVADGELLYLPFGALPSPIVAEGRPARPAGRPAPLILSHEIVNLPSASVLAALRASARRRPAPKSVAVFADPVFEKDDPRIRTAAVGQAAPPAERREALQQALRDTGEDGDGAKLPRLPSTIREARHILSAVPGGSGMEATGFQATRANATDPGLAQYRVVHFATHGILDEKRPELSGIVLSLYDEQGRFHEEGFLRLSDVYTLRLPVELVVLSACRTGLGQEVRGEGLIGLTRGFMYAGAPRVMATLWKVDDEATAELMRLFYRNMLRDGMTPAAALRAAQTSMSAHRRWASPYFWAGFILQGEWK